MARKSDLKEIFKTLDPPSVGPFYIWLFYCHLDHGCIVYIVPTDTIYFAQLNMLPFSDFA